MSHPVENGTARILRIDGKIVGTGFLAGKDLLVTCAHVVEASGTKEGDTIQVQFFGSDEIHTARSVPECWHDIDHGDIAVLRLEQAPAGVSPLNLGAASKSKPGEAFYGFGYTAVDGVQGIGTWGTIITLLPDHKLLQIRSHEANKGFSGAPVWDEKRGVVVGMITKGHVDIGRNAETTFAVPSERILEACPELRLYNDPMPRDADSQDQKSLLKLQKFLGLVRAKVDGGFEPALKVLQGLHVGREMQINEKAGLWGRGVLQHAEASIQPIPADRSMRTVFLDDSNGQLLILGEPGSGKTMTLLELARDLIAAAEENLQNQPVPVLLELASWQEKTVSFQDWVLEAMNRCYYIDSKTSSKWLSEERLVLLLDGLDEIKDDEQRIDCVNAINHFRKESGFGTLGIAVCSRTQEYDRLKTWLELGWKVLLKPLDAAQVDRFLERAGSELGALRQWLQEDAEALSLAQNPLMLNAMIAAYRDMDRSDQFYKGTARERRMQLQKDYMDKIFARRGLEDRYLKQDTLKWLAWLAGHVKGQEFMIEDLQPDWLSSRKKQMTYWFTLAAVVLPGIMILLWFFVRSGIGVFYDPWELEYDKSILFFHSYITAPLVACGGASVVWLTLRRTTGVMFVLAVTISMMVPIMVGIAQVAGWAFGAISAAFIGISFGLGLNWSGSHQARMNPHMRAIEPVKVRGFSIKRFLTGLLYGAVVGVIFLFILFFTAVLSNGVPLAEILSQMTIREFFEVVSENLIILAVEFPVFQSIFAFTGIFFAFTLGVLGGEVAIDQKAKPNRGTWRSGKNGLVVGLAVFVLLGSTVFLADIHDPWVTGFMLSVSAAAGYLLGLYFGGYTFVQHFLLRFILWREKKLPWRLAAFLDYASSLDFLREMGYAHKFPHPYWKDYFATLDEDSAR